MSQLGELGFSGGGHGHRAHKPRRAAGCIAVVIAFAVLATGGWLVWDRGQEWLTGVLTVPDYEGTGRDEVMVEVKSQQTAQDIGATLEAAGVVKSAEAFVREARNDERSRSIQPGFYTLREQMSGRAALSLILDPTSRILAQVTVQEGLRRGRVIDRITADTDLEKADLRAIIKDEADELNLPKYAKGDPEGFLFPATYDIDPGTTAQSLLTSMVDRYEQEATSLDLVARAKKIGRTPREIVTIASLIQAEVNRPDDMPKVAAVIYNRLNSDMRLELDSSLFYVKNEYGTVYLKPGDQEIDDPYNTHKYAGLPPGPINSPGSDALDAALSPADGEWLFFMTVNLESGETRFAKDHDEHLANVREFNNWCEEKKDRCP